MYVRVNFAYNFNTISWINRKLNTMNKLLNHIAQVFGWILQTLFPQVPERFFAHSVAQCGCDIPSIRRVTHRKPPFYFSSNKRFSCNGLSTSWSVTKAWHEQDKVKLKELIFSSGQEKVAVEGTIDAIQELQGAKNRQFWITTSEGTPQKRPNYKGTLETRQTQWLSHHASCRINLLVWSFLSHKSRKTIQKFFVCLFVFLFRMSQFGHLITHLRQKNLLQKFVLLRLGSQIRRLGRRYTFFHSSSQKT